MPGLPSEAIVCHKHAMGKDGVYAGQALRHAGRGGVFGTRLFYAALYRLVLRYAAVCFFPLTPCFCLTLALIYAVYSFKYPLSIY